MPIVIPYTKQTWIDNNGANPVSAARMGVLEEGILDVSQAPAVRVFHNAAQVLTSGTPLALAFNSDRFDQAGGVASTQHDTVTNNSRLTCLYAGVYDINACVSFGVSATGARQLLIRLNGVTTIGGAVAQGVATIETAVAVSTKYALAVNDYVEVMAFQNSGGNLNATVQANYSPEFMMVRVG